MTGHRYNEPHPHTIAVGSEFVVHLNVLDPIVAWNVYRGALLAAGSPAYAPFQRPVSPRFKSMLQSTCLLPLEAGLELVRQQHMPHAPSRLACIYLFPERPTAMRATELWSRFSISNLEDVRVVRSGQAVTVDSNWITFEHQRPPCEWGHYYWSGQPHPDGSPLWEILADVDVVVLGTKLRNEARDLLHDLFPLAKAILEIGRMGAYNGATLGNVAPFLVNLGSCEAPRLQIKYALDMRDAKDARFLERLAKDTSPRDYQSLAIGGDTFYLPDLERFETAVTANLSVVSPHLTPVKAAHF